MKNIIFDRFDDIAKYIVRQVQENSILSGFQYIVSYKDVQNTFSIKLNKYVNKQIINALYDREEVADIQEDEEGFDVVIYTSFAPNYIE